MSDDTVCPSCGQPKEFSHHPLCKYCFMRGQTNTMKMVILGIFVGKDINKLTAKDAKKISAKDFKKMTAEEVVTELNKLPFIKYPANFASIKKYLIKFTQFKILSASKVRSSKVGRPKKRHRITIRGMKIFQAYIKRWQQGGLLLLHKKHKKLRISSGDNERASAIRGKMLTKEYNSLEFIFPQRQKKISSSKSNQPYRKNEIIQHLQVLT